MGSICEDDASVCVSLRNKCLSSSFSVPACPLFTYILIAATSYLYSRVFCAFLVPATPPP